MVSKSKPEQPQPANLTLDQMREAIPKLKRRIAELEEIDVNTIQESGEPRFDALEHKIDSTLIDIFGNNTIEYNQFSIGNLDTAPICIGGEPPIYEVIEGYKRGIDHAISNIKTIIELFEEKIADSSETDTSNMQSFSFWDDIHPKVRDVAKPRYGSGHFADAVESAFKCINTTVKEIVKKKTGEELDGAALMNKAFSMSSPIISLDDLSTDTGKNIQKGYMQIFAGSMTGIRNPKAHDNIVIDEIRARHHIYLASLLLFVFDERV